MVDDVVEPGSPVVELEHTGPLPQRRATIAFRAILAIPHWVWAYLVSIAASFAVVGAWFAALFTGRVPDGLFQFNARFLRYNTRVLAYSALLTDRYPSFELDADDYDVELRLPPPMQLNRAAVFFRYFLAIPATLLMGIVVGGVSVAMFFVWLATLVKGRMPRSVHEALLATLRYSQRLYAYYFLLTPEYPHRLFGDRTEPAAPAPVVADDVVTDAELDLASAPPPSGAPLADVAATRTVRLVLGKGAKRLIALFIALSAVLFVGLVVVGIATDTQGDKAADRIEAQYDLLTEDIRAFSAQLQTCGFQGSADCMNKADTDLAAGLEDFRSELRDTSYPRGALGIAHDLEDDTDQLIDLLHQRSQVNSAAAYQSLSTRFVDVGNRFDQDYAD